MAATKNVVLVQETGDRNSFPVAASARLFQGAMAFLNVSGYACATPAATFLGHVAAEANNTSVTDGAIRADVFYGRYRLQVAVPSVALTSIGATVYATADNVLALSGTYAVGKVVRYVSANLAVVEFVAPGVYEGGS